MNNYKLVVDEILCWLEKYNKQAEDPEKYNLIPQKILDNKNINIKSLKKILIIGGNNCTSEQKLIRSINLENCTITSYDLIKPKNLKYLNIKKIKWVSKNVDEESNFNNEIFDMVICLATSRYFKDTFKVYSNVLSSLKKGALILIDFYDLPILRRKSTNIMNKWLVSEWKKNPESTIKKLGTIAKISKKLSVSLNKKDILIEDAIPEFGISNGRIFLQSLIYETIYPFWFKKNASVEEIRAILIYQFLSISNNCSQRKIKNFSKLNSLEILDLYKSTKDTNLLIGIKNE